MFQRFIITLISLILFVACLAGSASPGNAVTLKIGDVIIEADQDFSSTLRSKSSSFAFGLFGSSSRTQEDTITNEPAFVSSQGNVILDSGAGDLIINGSIVEAKKDIRINAQNVAFLSVENVRFFDQQTKRSGLFFDAFGGGSSAGISFGFRSEKERLTTEQRIALVTGIFAEGSIIIEATGDFTSEAASIIAGKDLVTNVGGDISLLSVDELQTRFESKKVKQVGLTRHGINHPDSDSVSQ